MFMLVIRALTRSELPPGLIVPISFFYFASLFGICFMVLRQGTRSVKETEAVRSFDTGEFNTRPAYLSPMTTAQIEEAREFGIGSVTDRTTRTLDEITIERRK
jgi:hypothetical protein